MVATVPTACGIETKTDEADANKKAGCNSTYRLRYWNKYKSGVSISGGRLQQYLPLAVLKLATNFLILVCLDQSCNSTYRLRYWN